MLDKSNLAAKARLVLDDLDLALDSDEAVMGQGDDAYLEHLIHEVAHGKLLRLTRFDSTLTDTISRMLSAFADDGVEQETRTWAIEWWCWQHFGLDQFEWGDLAAAAAIQGCCDGDVRELVDDDDEIYELSLATAKQVLELCGMEEHMDKYNEYTDQQKLMFELLMFDRSHIKLLAADHEIGEAARDGFLLRIEVKPLGFGPDEVKLTANNLLTEHSHLIDKVDAIKAEIKAESLS